ncbi:MAG: hypothetical protein K9N51_01145 [Candidatus Pacebacteria bacterium]|nr:hypothetical protein [Candidatus Paceibacterota bacterium]
MTQRYKPVLKTGPIILESHDAHLRDPSGVLLSEDRYHCWPTRVDMAVGSPVGYRGKVWHFAASSPEGPWEDLGPAILPASDPGAYDSLGTFTADAIFDPDRETWFLFYSAVDQNFTNERTVSGFGRTCIAMARSGSPDGPWEKLPLNPIITPGHEPEAWDGLRIDEAMPMVVFGEKRLYMRGVQLVCEQPFQNRQLPGLYLPENTGRWDCAYQASDHCPLTLPPNGARGFEAYAYFPDPDGILHMLSTNPIEGPRNQLGHAISRDGINWRHMEPLHLDNPGGYVFAVHPVWESATPGSDGKPTAMVTQILDTDGRMKVQLLTLEWIDRH